MTFLATSLSVTGNMSIKAEILFEIHLLNTLRLMVSVALWSCERWQLVSCEDSSFP